MSKENHIVRQETRRGQLADILAPMSPYTKDVTWEVIERLGLDHDMVLTDDEGNQIITGAYQARRIQSGESDLA